MTTRDPDREAEVIRRLTRHLEPPGRQIVVSIGDDAAVVRSGAQTILTTDTLVEGTHFRRSWLSSEDVGYKAMASAVSDVYAMGGTPTWATVAVTAPRDTPMALFDDLGRGVADAAREHDFEIVGGDVTRGPALVVTASVLGHASETPLRLDGAVPGEVVVVTGPVGGASCALAALTRRDEGGVLTPVENEFVSAFSRPRVDRSASRTLRRLGATAVTDVSDGLFPDARRIAIASGCDIALDRERVPLSLAVRAYLVNLGADPVDAAISSGEEYVLVATVPWWRELDAALREQGWSAVGEVRRPIGEPTVRWHHSGEPIEVREPFSHFG